MSQLNTDSNGLCLIKYSTCVCRGVCYYPITLYSKQINSNFVWYRPNT